MDTRFQTTTNRRYVNTVKGNAFCLTAHVASVLIIQHAYGKIPRIFYFTTFMNESIPRGNDSIFRDSAAYNLCRQSCADFTRITHDVRRKMADVVLLIAGKTWFWLS